MTIALAIRAEFDRRRQQGQAGVDARRMDRDVVNRNLALWRDMVMWTDGQVPIGKTDFSGWAAAAMTAAHKTAARLDRAAGSSPPLPAAQPDSQGWNTESIDHARTLRAASIKFASYATATAALRGLPELERIAA
jgi:hypothetical protein